MNESEILDQLITEVQDTVGDSVPVMTTGGDVSADPPFVRLEWATVPAPDDWGHRPDNGAVRDERGYADRQVFARTERFTASFRVRTNDELLREDLVVKIKNHFVPYMSMAHLFDEDTYLWELQDTTQPDYPQHEPDWYESVIPVRFGFGARAERDEDAIEAIEYELNVRDN